MTGIEASISAIILAAGESKRMGGKQKLLMPLEKTTILERTVDNYIDSEVSEVIVVAGLQAEEIKSLMINRRVRVVVNPDFHQGMSTSLTAGLNEITGKSRGVMIALADQPFIDSRTINLLIREFGTHGKGIVVPLYRGKRGHPVILSSKYKPELLALEGDIGARQILALNPDDILEVAVDCEGVLMDIDTIGSYNLAREKFGQ
jgi:molybdenum cofactor cytidylyltransferase